MNLDTTNAWLAVIAVASAVQVLVLLAAALLGYRFYRQTMQAVREIEQRQIAPLAERMQALMARVDAILVDVKDVTGTVARGTERVNATTGRVRASVAARVSQVAGLVHAVRSAVGHFWNGGRRGGESPLVM
ncbi:MAG: hypothetical protein HYU37_06520 [Acidobacteria bacterium]|nr:hypothetical protein [Acidobacteriota bacterium]